MVNGPMTVEGTNEKNGHSILKETDIQKKLTECKEALLKLDASAGDTLNLFSELESLSNREDAPCVSGVEVYDWAAKLIPIIREKLVSLGNMVQPRSSCPPAKSEDSRIETLLEKYAESLSRQVLDLVKKSL
ncbi:hypothetical protein AQUCO_00900751v1 [Aquilegia coerulea]|uniref:Uncharacterized protein n=1 Tax=Aquilegia coerulea TaxID=218851 RepID=A0A2G5EFC3_AQUCA|nr:hypothetical protein AQUCO_00900751v1 [Aquilegia coerulea]